MKNLIPLLILPLLLVATEVKSEDYTKEKAQFQKWANRLYFAFGKRADTNSDRRLSVSELRVFCDQELAPTDSSQNDLALRIINRKNPKADFNRDGVLTKPELLGYLDKFLESEGDFTTAAN